MNKKLPLVTGLQLFCLLPFIWEHTNKTGTSVRQDFNAAELTKTFLEMKVQNELVKQIQLVTEKLTSIQPLVTSSLPTSPVNEASFSCSHVPQHNHLGDLETSLKHVVPICCIPHFLMEVIMSMGACLGSTGTSYDS